MRLVRAAFIALAVALVAAGCTPRGIVRHIAAAHPGCVYEFSVRDSLVALTIDDGPERKTTARLLDLLAANDAQATFFLVSGRVRGNDSVVARIVRQGHEIGNHFPRNSPSILLRDDELEQELLLADSVLRRFAPLRWVRPAYGFYDQRMVNTFRAHGYRCALGSVHPFDAQLPFWRHGARVILRDVYPGAVIVLHDGGYKGRNTERILRRVLPELKRRGYSVVSLTRLAQADSTGWIGRGELTACRAAH